MNKSLIIFGIVNITSDSFSDGGRYLAPDAAIAQARKLMAEGADVIDLGPASSNPDAAPVSSDTEIARIAPVLDALKADGIPVSLDGTVAKLAMRQPFVLFKGLTFQKLCLPGAFRPGDHHNKMLRPGLCVVHASPQYL
nr:dihydropteroate synthase [Escherichia coli]